MPECECSVGFNSGGVNFEEKPSITCLDDAESNMGPMIRTVEPVQEVWVT